MQKLFDAIETVGPTEARRPDYRESGTALVARAIHHATLVVIHCGALTETLLEQAIRHEKGLQRSGRRKGKFEIAEGGTGVPR